MVIKCFLHRIDSIDHVFYLGENSTDVPLSTTQFKHDDASFTVVKKSIDETDNLDSNAELRTDEHKSTFTVKWDDTLEKTTENEIVEKYCIF